MRAAAVAVRVAGEPLIWMGRPGAPLGRETGVAPCAVDIANARRSVSQTRKKKPAF